MTTSLRRGEYTITTDAERLDLKAIHAFLTRSYWSPGVPIAIIERAVANSLCFGLFHGQDQVGLARVITDKATFAYLADVYVLEAHRGQGLSKWLLEVVQGHADLRVGDDRRGDEAVQPGDDPLALDRVPQPGQGLDGDDRGT